MAVLGFSHITSEVSSLATSIDFYKNHDFQLKFTLNMKVPQCKKQLLKRDASRVRLAYLIFKDDEACSLELIEHRPFQASSYSKDGRINLCFFTRHTDSDVSFIDCDGNKIAIFPQKNNEKAKHFFLAVKNLSLASSFYEKIFEMQTEHTDILTNSYNISKIPIWKSLTFKKCLFKNWDGYLHLVEDKDIVSRKRCLDELGFQSFCFLVSNAKKDIYAKINRTEIIGPIREKKCVKGKQIFFEVGFTYDPDGYPIEYLVVN